MKREIYILLLAVVLLWTGCADEGMNEPTQQVRIPLSICLPVNEVQVPSNSPRRVMGDPGSQEKFVLPSYIYIFIVKNYAAVGEDWKVWDQFVIDDATDSWQKEYYSGSLKGSTDSIYRFTRNIFKLLSPGEQFEGRVYAIASAEELTLTPALTNGSSTLDDLLALKFQTSGTMQKNLQNVYSTPYNYIVGGKYYGSFSSKIYNVPYVYLMLYHVAAKVDITWNVADTVRIKTDPAKVVRLTHMKACNLFNDKAYCFKPMANRAASKLTTNDTITIVTKDDEGLWWEGRSYFYTIPYTTTGKPGYFPLQMEMGTNDSTKYYKPTINLNIENDTTFVPWLRATFNITQPLTAGSKDIDV